MHINMQMFHSKQTFILRINLNSLSISISMMILITNMLSTSNL